MIKRVLCLILIIAAVMSAPSCTFSFFDAKMENPVGGTDGIYVEISEIMSNLNAEREAIANEPRGYDGVEEFIKCDKSLYSLLTKEEIYALCGKSDTSPDSIITYDDAVYDIDLFFRLLKLHYGAYYYFGGDDAFLPAKYEAIKKLENSASITRDMIAKAILESISFAVDGHLAADGVSTAENQRCWYAQEHQFLRDDGGFYKYINGEKWYISEFSDDRISMELSLNDMGEIIYSPVLVIKDGENAPKSFLTLENGGKIKYQTLKWEKIYHFWPLSDADYNFVQENGITYISIRSFSRDYDDVLQTFINDAVTARESKCLILDLRGNRGGLASYPSKWITNFTGIKPSVWQFQYTRYDSLDFYRYGSELSDSEYCYYDVDVYEYDEKIIENDIPIFVLIDGNTASSGEYAVEYLKTLQNVVVIGGVSRGCMLTVRDDFVLPRSGVEVSIGSEMNLFNNSIENSDVAGIRPDIFCDTSNALPVVLKMIGIYGIADVDGLEKIAELSKKG